MDLLRLHFGSVYHPPQGLGEGKTTYLQASVTRTWTSPTQTVLEYMPGTVWLLKNDGSTVAGPFSITNQFSTRYTAPRFGRQLRLMIYANQRTNVATAYGQLTRQ